MENRLGKLMEFNAQRLFMDQFFFPYGIVVVFWMALYMWCIFIAWSNGRDTHINPKATTKKQINKLNVFFLLANIFLVVFIYLLFNHDKKWEISEQSKPKAIRVVFFVDAASEK